MTGSRAGRRRTGPGRPSAGQARDAVLRVTVAMMREVGPRAMTTEEVARRSGVSKATIYKWWPSKYALAVEAFLSEMFGESRDHASEPDSGSVREDFRIALRGLIRFYASPSGGVFAQLVGEAQFDPLLAKELRDRLVGSRRRQVRLMCQRGVARGELCPDLDPDVALDLVFGPAVYRLVAGHAPPREADADAIVDLAMRGIACLRD